ncbi:hypothetical protein [Streptomyces sp. NPDC048256]|uniref:hypothetical protein n=1 Tax=Streptomyces sp. NPDC048256 TaxID=3154613 RepID=UPI0033DD4064
MSTSTLSLADRRAHVEAQGPVRTAPASKPGRTVLKSFPAGAPRGQWPAESFAAEQRREGVPARVVMDLASDSYLVIVEGPAADDHSKTKEPLPQRPRGPHPYRSAS